MPPRFAQITTPTNYTVTYGSSPMQINFENIGRTLIPTNIVYTMSNPSVASLSATGLISFLQPGKTTLTILEIRNSSGTYYVDSTITITVNPLTITSDPITNVSNPVNKLLTQTPVKQVINNGTLSGRGAMPAKDSTSSDNNTFSMGRNMFTRTFSQTQTNTSYLEKKYYGSSRNRDASVIVEQNKLLEIGVTKNASEAPIAFTTTEDKNTTRQALHRVRSGGSVVPPKRAFS